MKCPFCKRLESEVLESRLSEEGNSLRRRRRCLSCLKRFTTFERVKENTVLVIKNDGRRENFDREKLRRGLTKALEKRPVSYDQINNLVSIIEQEVLATGEPEIMSRKIGALVLKRLYDIDHVAWIRFASVYLEFEDFSDFQKMIKKKYEKEN